MAAISPARGDELTRLTFNPGIDRHPAWTPDGTHIVYESAETGELRIHRIPVGGGPSEQLSTGPGADRFPEVSPDGTQIVFTREDSIGGASLFLMPADGGMALQLSLPDTTNDLDWHGTFSPDGTTVYFSRRRGNSAAHWDIYSVPATGGPHRATLVYTAQGIQNRPHISRDGLLITFENDFNGPALNVIEAPLSDPANQTQLTFYDRNTASLEYSRDDSRLLYSTRQDLGMLEMWELDRASQTTTRLTFDVGMFPYDPAAIDGAYSPDGGTIAFTSRRTTGQDEIWLLKLARGPVFAACPTCPTISEPVVPGQTFTFSFDVCNCGSSGDGFAWCLMDGAGWLTPVCGQGALAPGECRTISQTIRVPDDAHDGKLNHFTVEIQQVGLPAIRQTCQTGIKVDLPPVGVVLSRFTGSTTGSGFELEWEMVADQAHASFDIERGPNADGPFTRLNGSPILPASGGDEGHCRFVDPDLHPGTSYVYRIEAVDRSGGRSIVAISTFVHGEIAPAGLRLSSAPNPFEGSTRIQVTVPLGETGLIRIFDSQGRLVKSIGPLDTQTAGLHTIEWTGDTDSGTPAPSGFYLVRADFGGTSEAIRLFRLK